MKQYIEIDCAPGFARPDSYIKGVMEGSGVEYDGREPVSMCFGNWTWVFDDIDEETWKDAQATFQQRITTLYEQGFIRYGSW
jgi:hypothetical protein